MSCLVRVRGCGPSGVSWRLTDAVGFSRVGRRVAWVLRAQIW